MNFIGSFDTLEIYLINLINCVLTYLRNNQVALAPRLTVASDRCSFWRISHCVRKCGLQDRDNILASPATFDPLKRIYNCNWLYRIPHLWLSVISNDFVLARSGRNCERHVNHTWPEVCQANSYPIQNSQCEKNLPILEIEAECWKWSLDDPFRRLRLRSRLWRVLRSKVFRILSRRLPQSEYYLLKIKDRVHNVSCVRTYAQHRGKMCIYPHVCTWHCLIKPVIIITRILASLSSVITGAVGRFNRFSKIINPKNSKSRSTISRVSFDIYKHTGNIALLRYLKSA